MYGTLAETKENLVRSGISPRKWSDVEIETQDLSFVRPIKQLHKVTIKQRTTTYGFDTCRTDFSCK